MGPLTTAILWMLLAQFGGSVVNASARFIGESVSPLQISALTFLWALFFAFLYYAPKGIGRFYGSKAHKLYVLRAILEVIGFAALFYACTVIPLTMVTSLTFSLPIFISIMAVLVFREKLTMGIVVALLCGVVGVVIIQHPNPADIQLNALWVIFAAFIFSLCGLIIKKLTFSESSEAVVWHMMAYTTPITVIIALPFWSAVDAKTLMVSALGGFFFIVMQIGVTKAFALAPIVKVIPYHFTRLIFMSVIAYVFFGEIVEMSTIIGGVVILAGATLAYSAKDKPGDYREDPV